MTDRPGPVPVPDPNQGPSDDARFRPCYRHADRRTGITCQRCNRPICGGCMNPASVGFQCADCIGAANAGVREARSRRPFAGGGTDSAMAGFGLRRPAFGAPTVLAGIVALIGIADLITGGAMTQLLAYSNALVAVGQPWRALTWVLIPGGLIGLIFNVLFLIVIGNAVEAMMGGARMIAVFFLCGLGGAAALALFAGPSAAGIGTGVALIGLLGASAALKFRQGQDIRPDLILFALLLVMNGVLGGLAGSLVGLLSLVGGVLAGMVGGVILGWAPGRAGVRERNQWLLLAGAAVGFAALIGAGTLL